MTGPNSEPPPTCAALPGAPREYTPDRGKFDKFARRYTPHHAKFDNFG